MGNGAVDLFISQLSKPVAQLIGVLGGESGFVYLLARLGINRRTLQHYVSTTTCAFTLGAHKTTTIRQEGSALLPWSSIRAHGQMTKMN